MSKEYKPLWQTVIEQLGGYEKAKNIRLGNEEDWMFYSIKKDWYSDIKHDESFIFIDELKYQLLQYRREHNIFEVGDLIVLCYTNYRNDVFELTRIFQETYDEKGIAYRHATDAEIQAGHKL